MRNIALLCNPTAHKNKAFSIAKQIGEKLQSKNVSYSIFIENWPGELNGFTDAWIIGGDGTINYFINNYPDINLPLSIFAGGTGNDFHWMLYCKISVEDQVEKLLYGDKKKVDAGICNGKLFLNGVGLGFDGAIISDLQGKKKFSGKTSYMISILKNLMFFREKNCVLITGERENKEHVFMISVMNTKRVGGGYHVTPKAEINDGFLDVNLVGKVSLLQRMKYMPVIEKGKHLDKNISFLKYIKTDKIILESETEISGQRDGEWINGKRFEIECLAGKFTFIY